MSNVKINLENSGIDDKEILSFQSKVQEIHNNMNLIADNEDEFLGWLNLPDNYDKAEVIRIKKAAEKLEEISSDEVLQRLAEWKEAGEHQEASMLAQAKEEGSQEEKRNIAKNMKKENIDISVIIKVTGLTREEIETLS